MQCDKCNQLATFKFIDPTCPDDSFFKGSYFSACKEHVSIVKQELPSYYVMVETKD